MILLAAFNKSIAEELSARLLEAKADPDREYSPLQNAIFENLANGEGHTVVVARAGTGKTTTIIEGVRRLPDDVEAQTLHSAGFRLLKSYTGAIKVDNKAGFQELIDLTEQFLGSQGIASESNLAKFLLNPGTTNKAEKVVSWVKGTDPLFRNCEPFTSAAEQFLDTDLPEGEEQEAILAVAKIAMKSCLCRLEGFKKKTQRWCSFDDMIWAPVRLGLKPARKL